MEGDALVRLVAALSLALLGVRAPVAADRIHKCRGPDGTLHYQDERCAPGTALETPVIVEAPPFDAGAAGAGVAPRDEPPLARPEAPRPPREAPPPLFRCERHDGQERYVTTDAQPRRYQVPLWTVVGHAGPAGGAYTWVEDRCAPMGAREQCGYWDARRGEAMGRRRDAFRDERVQLDAEVARLRADLARYCGG